MKIHIIGGGIAGLSAAYSLSHEFEVVIWEKENLPCSMSSAKNAAIFRTYEADPTLSLLVKESYLSLLEFEKEGESLMDRRGLLIDPLELDYYEESFINKTIEAENLRSSNDSYTFWDHSEFKGIWLKENGVIDIHSFQKMLLNKINSSGVIINTNKAVNSISLTEGRISGFSTGDENVILDEEDVMINAAGAWTTELMQKNKMTLLPVAPYKRHLFLIRGGNFEEYRKMPVIWDEKHDIYMRPESKGLLITHCDQREVLAGDYSSSEKEVERFLHAVTTVFPILKNFHISRYWACLRTFSLDQHPVVGFDPEIKNLFWVAGLGGRGMTIAPALTRLVKEIFKNELKSNPYSPRRFFL